MSEPGHSRVLAPDETRLVFDAPASDFTESCPIGNGRLGAMVFGGVPVDRIVLNEESMWSGSPETADRADAHLQLAEVRRLIFAGRHADAQALVNATFTCANQGSALGQGKDAPYGCYQMLAVLELAFPSFGKLKSYHRDLDLPTATARISTEDESGAITREVFASAVDDVIVYRLHSSTPCGLDFDVSLRREENARTEVTGDTLLLHGALPDGQQGPGHGFAALVRVVHDGESNAAGGLSIRRASSATLLVAAGVRHGVEFSVTDLQTRLEIVARQKFEILRERHIQDFRPRFDRVTLHLPCRASKVPTPDRIAQCGQGEVDPSLSSLYFHFGRYLLLSSSRETNALPANLQGIWAQEIQTPWNGDFHLNINLQMNYWPAETASLTECFPPLLSLVEGLVPHGHKTARAYYDCRGWVAHMMTNPWRFTAPGENASWGSSVTGGAWLCQHLWSHYEFSRDEVYLRKVYPLLKGAAEFFGEFLVEDPDTRWLVTCPSSSPENTFENPQGETASVCAGPTMDIAIIRELFRNVIEAAETLGCDTAWTGQLKALIVRLPPYQVGRFGQLQEWLSDFSECEPEHRHFSHLYGLFPGSDICAHPATPITEAARTSLLRRGEDSTGWSSAWKACCWARLGDGERALTFLRKLTKPPAGKCHPLPGGGYPNLFCAHPPFQIDGNFGGTAAVAEMLLQSHERIPGEPACESYVLSILPALPHDWDCGSFDGLRVRGNLTAGAEWAGGLLTRIRIFSPAKRTAFVRYGKTLRRLRLAAGDNAFLWDQQKETFSPIE